VNERDPTEARIDAARLVVPVIEALNVIRAVHPERRPQPRCARRSRVAAQQIEDALGGICRAHVEVGHAERVELDQADLELLRVARMLRGQYRALADAPAAASGAAAEARAALQERVTKIEGHVIAAAVEGWRDR